MRNDRGLSNVKFLRLLVLRNRILSLLPQMCQTVAQPLHDIKCQHRIRRELLSLLTLLQLITDLRHGLLAAVLDERHDDLLLRDGHYCRLRGCALLDDLGDAHLVFLLPRQHCIIFDRDILDGVVLLLLIRIAQPAAGVESELYKNF